jgi:putative methionine-R-sulfoxide reductase with GAF domain
MSRVALRRVLAPGTPALALIATMAEAIGAPVVVEDMEGRVLHGESGAAASARVPVVHDGACVGWVSGATGALPIAALLACFAGQESERKALGAEVLHLYREVNLIYSFSEKLAAQLEVGRVAQLMLSEARHLIVATDGVLALVDESDALVMLAGFGDELPALHGFARGVGIIGAVAASGIGEVVNDVPRDPRLVSADTSLSALICTPLKVGERVIGLIALGSTAAREYAAADLKLLTTLALQAATAIENARLFERSMQAARERERLMALHQTAEVARAKLDSELAVAARIQTDLFPRTLPAATGYELAARNRSARRCGGDYYDVLPRSADPDSGRLLLCVADVSG